MTRIEVLVASVNQKDNSLFEEMRINSDAIICNQCEKNDFSETMVSGHRVRLLSSNTRGVGINRNLGLSLSDADICLLADDDVVYQKNYEKTVVEAFNKYPQADIIAFNLDSSGYKKISNYSKKSGRSFRSFGACRLALRMSRINEKRLCFSKEFGGGAKYSSGEDSLFLVDARKAGLRVYAVTDVIGTVYYRNSSWFHGYTEKYFFDLGKYMKTAYPVLWPITTASLFVRRHASLFKECRISRAFSCLIKGALNREYER